MNKKLFAQLRKILSMIMLAVLLVPAAPALAHREVLHARSVRPVRPAGNPGPALTRSSGTWSALGTGMDSNVNAIALSGSDLYVGGWFTSAGSCTSGCNHIAKWDGSNWSALGTGTNGDVYAIAINGSDLYAGGDFTSAGDCTIGCNGIAKWNGSTWSALGTGMDNTVMSIAISGSSVYAGGWFNSAGDCTSGCNYIARWNGSSWSRMGTGTNDAVRTITLSGSTLYAGGQFTSAGTCTSGCNYIAKWNGSTWSRMGTGLGGDYPYVYAIAVSGTSVYAGGDFTSAGTCTNRCSGIAKWNGSTWSALGTGMDTGVSSIAISGSDLYAGGYFTSAGTCTSGCNYTAKWNGSTWSALGTGTSDWVNAIAADTEAVYAGGWFTSAGTCTVGCNYIAKILPPSNNAALSSLVLSTGALTPVFAPGTFVYTQSVANAITSVTVTPTTADAGATIRVRINGGAWSAVISGNPSGGLLLNVGANPIDVQVTAADGITIKLYTVTVNRAASANANLSSLVLSTGALTPAFAPVTIVYTQSVVNAITSLTITPTVANAGATIRVRINSGTWSAVISGTPSGALYLNAGANPINVQVTAADGITIITYTVTVTRAASSNANLSSLVLSTGALTPAFAPGTHVYTQSVANAITSLTVTPTVANAGATIRVRINGGAWGAVISGTPSGALLLNVGANPIDVQVTATDGQTANTYTVTVTRDATSTYRITLPLVKR